MSRFGELRDELKRRRVYRVGAAYAVTGVAVLEIAGLILPGLALPDWVYSFLVVSTLAGFPLALILAWALELTPDGIRRTDGGSKERRAVSAYAALGGAVAVTVLVGWVLLRDTPRPSSFARPDGRIGLAVLPFENMSGTPEDLQFTDGLHEEILNRLAGVQAFHLISRTSVMGYRDEPKPVPVVAEELGVDVVLEASVRRAGERLRITVQLIDARSDDHIWSDAYNTEYVIDELFDVQSEIASSVTRELRISLGASERRIVERRPTSSLAAYEAFVRGRTRLETWSEEGTDNAIAYFREATEADPEFALAYAGIAEAYAWGIGSGLFDDTQVAEAREAVSRALQLDDELGAAHTAQAVLHYYVDQDWEASERRFRRGLALRPNDPNAHHWFGHLLMNLGRVEEALEIARRGHEVDPLSPAMNLQWAWELFYARRYQEAVEQLRRAVEMEEDYARFRRLEARALARLGRLPEAQIVWQGVVDRLGEGSLSQAGCFLTLVGRSAEAEVRLRELRAMADASPTSLAYLETCLGNTAQALDALEQAQREGLHPGGLVVDARLDPLREEPRYRAVVEAWALPSHPVFGSIR